MGVDEHGALGAGDPDDARGQTEHEPELAREGQAPAGAPGPIVWNAVHELAPVMVGALLGRGQHDRLEPQALLCRHDAAAPVAVAAPDGQGVIEDVEHLHGVPPRPEVAAIAPSSLSPCRRAWNC